MSYLYWDKQNITNFSPEHIATMYDRGFVCTRPEAGSMEQTRSVRVDLSTFELSSENRRILRNTETISLSTQSLPLAEYHWQIGKIGKDFYETKFGDGTFSANKIKELLTSGRKDFNTLLVYSETKQDMPVGYAICVETPELLHYSYPFYDLDSGVASLGMSMMVRAIDYAKTAGKKYCYLGSAQRPGDTYKFQFTGMEWYDGKVWQTDLEELKTLLSRDT